MMHTAYFGDGVKSFALTPEMIIELERQTGSTIGAIYGRFMVSQFGFNDIIQIIRLGLIGGSTAPIDAQTFIDSYAKPRPIMEIMPLAFDILDLAWNGAPTEPAATDAVDQAAINGDMAAAINEALVQVAP